MRCDNVMTNVVAKVGVKQTAQEAARLMLNLNVGFIPVCESDDKAIGTITDRDLALRVVAEDLPATTTVQDIMTGEVVACGPDDDLATARDLMRQHHVGRVLVVDDGGRVMGVISLSDLAQIGDEGEVGRTFADVSEREATHH